MPADFVEFSRDRLAPQLVGPVGRLLAISDHADGDRPELQDARAFLAKR